MLGKRNNTTITVDPFDTRSEGNMVFEVMEVLQCLK
jgi:hypothetical protein